MKKTCIAEIIWLSTFLLILSCLLPAQGVQGGQGIGIETIVDGLSHPWSIAILPNNSRSTGIPTEALVTIRSGKLLRISNIASPKQNQNVEVQEITGLPAIHSQGQGGLLDVIASPQFSTNSRLYFSASFRDSGGYGTAVYSAVLRDEHLRELQELFRLQQTTYSNVHFGSRLAIGPGNDLYVSIGERGEPARAQDRNDAAGSIVRIPLSENGSLARNYNPSKLEEVDRGSRTSPSIYSYGHRNIQGLVYFEDLDRLIAHEHGPRGGDEINLIRPNANYGWPLVSYGVNYNGTKVSEYQSLPGITEPLLYWTPSIAPSGFAVYPETGIFAKDLGQGWSKNFFVGALAAQHIRKLSLPSQWQNAEFPLNGTIDEVELFKNRLGRIRDIRIDEFGYIYVLSDEPQGKLYRLFPENN